MRSSLCGLLPLNYLAFQSFDFEHTWWGLFQKCVVHTKFDIYVFFKFYKRDWNQTLHGEAPLDDLKFMCCTVSFKVHVIYRSSMYLMPIHLELDLSTFVTEEKTVSFGLDIMASRWLYLQYDLKWMITDLIFNIALLFTTFTISYLLYSTPMPVHSHYTQHQYFDNLLLSTSAMLNTSTCSQLLCSAPIVVNIGCA
jgi:hypothetical protein